MKITWLGQFSLLIQTNNTTLMVDPYLTDTIAETSGPAFRRLVPLRQEYLQVRPDMVLLTHDHIDHLDIPSMKALLDNPKPVEVLAAANAWGKVRSQVGGPHNYVQMIPNTEWTSGDIHIRAVPAVHSDTTAVGYVIHAEGLTLYLTGDTLYSRNVISQIGEPIDVLFTVVNGQGNNMNAVDAARFAAALQPRMTIPVHWGLFAKFADTPDAFLQAARQLGVPAYGARIYETLDVQTLWEKTV